MKKALFCFLLSAVATFLLQAQSTSVKSSILQAAQPSAAGISAERLNRIDAVLQQYINQQWIAGAAAIVVKDGKIVYYKSLGYDDVEKKTPLKKDAIFRIASQTKAITSVGVMMLMEEGRFLLDDAVSKYLPEYKNPKVIDQYHAADTTYTTVPAKREITIRDLLTHTSGIGYAQIGSAQMNAIYAKAGVVGGIGVDNIILADKMKILGSLPLVHQPGEKWTYGLNTDVLGYLIEVVSGLSLDAFFRQRIFEPLGMNDTYFYIPPAKQSRLARLYTENEEKNAIKAPPVINLNGNFYPDYPASKGTYFSGGGGLSSTAFDFAIFMQMLLNGGQYNGKRILSSASIRMMTANQIGEKSLWGGNKFGLGFEVVTESNSGKSPLNPGAFHWGGMFSSSYWIDPKQKLAGQLFLQQYPNSHGDIHEKFKVAVYQALND